MYAKWVCLNCGKEHFSIDKRHHQMDMCKCGKSGVDYETYMTRLLGQARILKRLNYDFFDELLECYKEQGFKIKTYLDWTFGFPIQVYDLDFIRKLEDEMLENMTYKKSKIIPGEQGFKEIVRCAEEQGIVELVYIDKKGYLTIQDYMKIRNVKW